MTLATPLQNSSSPVYCANGITPISDWGVIQVDGEDSAKFLHGQLTQDFALLTPQQARLAAFCSAKGRMQASFIGFKRSDSQVLLICSKDLLAATLKRLSMFVLRAKAKLSDASGAYALYGLSGAATQSAAPTAPAAPWALHSQDATQVVQLYPADGVPRQLWVAPSDTPAPAGPLVDAATWQWGEVRSGIATLTAPVVDAFVPQMLNYESVGGVNFKKGCYPGQEVVARSQFRGTLKRRTYLVHTSGVLAAGQEVFGPEDATQPVGQVVQVAACPEGGWDALVCLQISSAEAGGLHCGGTALALLPLPYALLEDI